MPLLYPSQAWCEAWKEAVNSSSAVEQTGKDWADGFNGNFLFEIRPGVGLKQTAYVYCVVAPGGKAADCRIVSGPDETELGFLASGPYQRFVEIISGKRDFIEVVLRGEVKLKGDMSKIMRHARYVRAVANTLTTLDTEYLTEE